MSLVRDILTVTGVSEADIATLETMLKRNATTLYDGRPHAIGGGSFGGSPAGRDLDTQVATAHRHVVEAIEEMAAGLQAYSSNIRKFADDMTFTDADAEARMRSLNEANACTTPDNFHANAACTPPAQVQDHGADA
jgi:sugar phosphate isomerase/epimerase